MSLLNGLSAAGYGLAQVGMEGVRSALDQERIKLADSLAGAREERTDYRREDIRRSGKQADIDLETSDATVAARGRAASGLINATTEAEANKRKRFAEIDTQQKVDEFTQLAPLKRKEAIDTAVEQVKALATPEMLEASRKIALSKHIVDPSYTLIPNADGTMTTFDSKSGKSGGVVKDPEGNPVIRKDPEEMKAAVSVINMANTNLRIAQAAYKAAEADVAADPATKATAAQEWKVAQEEAKRLTAPAYAVLYSKAKITGETQPPEAKPAAGAPKPGTVVGDYEFKGGDPNNKDNWTPKAKPAEEKKPGMLNSNRTEPGGGYQPVTAADYVAKGEGDTSSKKRAMDDIARIERALATPNLDASQKASLSLDLQDAMRRAGKLGTDKN